MKRSNLIPITRIYDIYPKYTFSNDVKRFMDEIVDIDRADVYTKDEVITMLTEIQTEISEHWDNDPSYIEGVYDSEMVIQNKINALNKENK